MSYKIKKFDLWSAELEDHPGSVTEKLKVLADAGANLEFVLARRTPENPGKGVLYVAPISGKKIVSAAESAYFIRTSDLTAVRIEGPNKAGLGHRVTEAVSQAGVNLRGLSASVLGGKFVFILAFDNTSDAERSLKALKRVR